jgi:hypothetical protein
MLKAGLDKNQSVVTTQAAAASGCGCGKAAAVKISQKEKEKRLQAISDKMNKTRNSIYKTKAPIF